MNSTLERIMLSLRRGINSSHQILDPALIEQAVDELEVFPMTIEVLKESGAAQKLQEIRHKVDPPLQKRIRFIIKSWQRLIDPNSGVTSVIPVQCKPSVNGGDNNGRGSNGFVKPVATHSPLVQNANGHPKPPRSQSSLPVSNNHRRHESPLTHPAKVLKRSDSFSSNDTAQPSPLPNGHSPKVIPHENGRLHPISTAPKLSKVKSTAELIQEAGLSIDPLTKDRILGNRIAKESDEVAHVAPLATMRSSRKCKVQRQQEKQQLFLQEQQQQQLQQRQSQPIPKSRKKSVDRIPPKPASVAVLPTLKEEIPPRQNSTKPPSIPPIKLDRIHSLLKQEPFDLKDSADSDHKSNQHKEKRQKLDPDADVKRNLEPIEERKPLPNHMDNIPPLPPISREMAYQLSYRSGKTPTAEELSDIGRVKDIINGQWEGVSATRDHEGNLRSMTEIYSVPINEEELLTILPWTNLEGYRQVFFPPGFTTAEDIDRLIDLPEPW